MTPVPLVPGDVTVGPPAVKVVGSTRDGHDGPRARPGSFGRPGQCPPSPPTERESGSDEEE